MVLKFHKSAPNVTYKEEAESNLAMKVDFAIRIKKMIRQKKWSQDKAAKRLGANQERFSDLMSGKVETFTLKAMLDMLRALD